MGWEGSYLEWLPRRSFYGQLEWSDLGLWEPAQSFTNRRQREPSTSLFNPRQFLSCVLACIWLLGRTGTPEATVAILRSLGSKRSCGKNQGLGLCNQAMRLCLSFLFQVGGLPLLFQQPALHSVFPFNLPLADRSGAA